MLLKFLESSLVSGYVAYKYSKREKSNGQKNPVTGDLWLNYVFCYSTISNFQLHWSLKGLKYLEIYVAAELDEVFSSELFNYLETASWNWMVWIITFKMYFQRYY